MKSLVLAALLVACRSKEPAPTPPAPAPPSTPPVAVAIDAAAPAPKLPGTLYFKIGDGLAKLADGELVTDFADAGAPVFPSQLALPDGRIVGIASKGNGEPGSEQLVLIDGAKIERIGPAITQVRNPAVDPRGAWIVIEAKLEPHSELYKIDLATQKSTQLTDNKEGNFTPSVLDPKTIVFASSRDGDSEIYKLDLATKKQTRITAFHRDDWSPRPSSKTIAFLSDREGPPKIFLVDADGTNLRRLSPGGDGDEDEPTWSPDGKSLAFLRAGKLVIRDLATNSERTLTPDTARDAEPTWSPDGQWLAVARTPIGTGSAASGTSDIVAIPLAGTGDIAITSAANARLPRWHR